MSMASHFRNAAPEETQTTRYVTTRHDNPKTAISLTDKPKRTPSSRHQRSVGVRCRVVRANLYSPTPLSFRNAILAAHTLFSPAPLKGVTGYMGKKRLSKTTWKCFTRSVADCRPIIWYRVWTSGQCVAKNNKFSLTRPWSQVSEVESRSCLKQKEILVYSK